MAESQGEQERLESLRGDRLPWERGECLDQIRERREGGRGRASERRGEHESQRTERRPRGLARDNKEKERRSQRRGAVLSHLLTSES
jgi:hypothetical protein